MFHLKKSAEPAPLIAASQTATSGFVAQRYEAILRNSSHAPLRALTCEFHEGVLSIRGVVPSFYLKQLAQALLANAKDVEEINNRVVVQPRKESQRP